MRFIFRCLYSLYIYIHLRNKSTAENLLFVPYAERIHGLEGTDDFVSSNKDSIKCALIDVDLATS